MGRGRGWGGGGVKMKSFLQASLIFHFLFFGGGGNYHNLRTRKDKNSLILF